MQRPSQSSQPAQVKESRPSSAHAEIHIPRASQQPDISSELIPTTTMRPSRQTVQRLQYAPSVERRIQELHPVLSWLMYIITQPQSQKQPPVQRKVLQPTHVHAVTATQSLLPRQHTASGSMSITMMPQQRRTAPRQQPVQYAA